MNENLKKNEEKFVRRIKELDHDYGDFVEEKQNLELERFNSKKNIIELENKIKKTKNELDKTNDELKIIDHADKDRLTSQEESLKNEIGKLEDQKKKKIMAKEKFIIENFPKILSYSEFKYFIELGSDLEEKGYIPPQFKREFLKTLIEDKRCICGVDLKENLESLAKIQKLHDNTPEETNISEEVNIEINGIKNELKNIGKFSNKQKEFNKNIGQIEKDIIKKKEMLEDIELQLDQINHEEIQRLRDLKKDLEDEKDNLLRKQAHEDHKIDTVNNELEKINADEKKMMNNNEKILVFNKKLDFIKKVRHASELLENRIVENIREKIEKITNKQFSQLMWKSTLRNVTVDKDYNVFVQRSGKKISPNDMSAGERLALALSFVVALNSISGFNLPIMIDTPMGRLDREIKGNIAKTLPNFSKKNQIVLIVTGEEYTPEFKEIIKKEVGREYRIEVNERNNGSESEVIKC